MNSEISTDIHFKPQSNIEDKIDYLKISESLLNTTEIDSSYNLDESLEKIDNILQKLILKTTENDKIRLNEKNVNSYESEINTSDIMNIDYSLNSASLNSAADNGILPINEATTITLNNKTQKEPKYKLTSDKNNKIMSETQSMIDNLIENTLKIG